MQQSCRFKRQYGMLCDTCRTQSCKVYMALKRIKHNDELIQVVEKMLIDIEGVTPDSLYGNQDREIPTTFYLVYIADEAICVVETFSETPGEFFLTNFGITEHRQNTGLGRQCLEIMEQHAKHQGYNALQLTSLPDAYGFYLKCGYQKHGCSEYDLRKVL